MRCSSAVRAGDQLASGEGIGGEGQETEKTSSMKDSRKWVLYSPLR